MSTVYIAGPMRGCKSFNFPAFDLAAAHLRKQGYEVLSPAEHDRENGFDETKETLDGFDMVAALKWDVHAVIEADALVLLPGWEHSVGANAELAIARWAGKDIYKIDLETGALFWFEDKMTEDEVRITSVTGGQKGQKLARYDLVPVKPLWALAEHFGRGASKYAARNWERGTDWSLNYAAMMRHATQWWGGEDVDPETGSHHLTSVAWHAFALVEFADTHPELDDRPVKPS